MNDVKCFGGTRAVNKLASLVRVQENGEVCPLAKLAYLFLSNVLHTVLLDNLSPWSLETVLSCTACRKPLFKAVCHM